MKTLGGFLFACVALLGAPRLASQGAGAAPQFTTVSIKPLRRPTAAEVQANPALQLRRVDERDPKRFHVTDLLGSMITIAYGVSQMQLVTTPAQTELGQWYDFTGITDVPATRAQMQGMLQEALRSRFHLTVHHEPKETGLFAMVIDEGGLKLEKLDDGARVTRNEGELFAGPSLNQLVVYLNSAAENQMVGMTYPVVDHTGLTGEFAIHLKAPWGRKLGVAEDDDYSLPDLVQQQLGLKLVKTRGRLDYLVVDSVAPLTGN